MSVTASGGGRLEHKLVTRADIVDATADLGLGSNIVPKADDFQNNTMVIGPEAGEEWHIRQIEAQGSIAMSDKASDPTDYNHIVMEVSERDTPTLTFDDLQNASGTTTSDPEERDGVLAVAENLHLATGADADGNVSGVPATADVDWEPQSGSYVLRHPGKLNLNVVLASRSNSSNTGNLIFQGYMVATYESRDVSR